jgi:hypothetical protein
MARGRKGRPRKTAEQKLRDALDRTLPAEYILARRKLFSFVEPSMKDKLGGRNGEIDSEICDAIGQMCALGLLDGHGHDPIELRDKGRRIRTHLTLRGHGSLDQRRPAVRPH